MAQILQIKETSMLNSMLHTLLSEFLPKILPSKNRLDTDWELNQVQFFSEYECKKSALIVPVGRLSNSKK